MGKVKYLLCVYWPVRMVTVSNGCLTPLSNIITDGRPSVLLWQTKI